ncbi:MAG: hypothetical protein RLZZ601_662 [Pseudomonadota bacterium]
MAVMKCSKFTIQSRLMKPKLCKGIPENSRPRTTLKEKAERVKADPQNIEVGTNLESFIIKGYKNSFD